MAEIDDIINAARAAVTWQVNLILNPAEISVLMIEYERLRSIEYSFQKKILEKIEQEQAAK